MRFEKLFNPIEDLDLKELDDPDFKEDSVREEIILPIIKHLGYSASKPCKIIRSKSLIHSFVSVGSARKKVTCIPDYLLEVNDKYAWVLEAKGPGENILSGAHVEQAYSYAIHSEIRVPIFALCNGRDFVVFHISQEKPLLQFSIEALPQYICELKKLLAPENVLTYEFKLAKDLGLHLKRLGFKQFENIVFPNVPISYIAQLDGNLFTTGTSTSLLGGDSYVMSLDFDLRALAQLKDKVPEKSLEILLRRKPEERSVVRFANGSFLVNVDCRIGEEMQENESEIFLPFIVNRFV